MRGLSSSNNHFAKHWPRTPLLCDSHLPRSPLESVVAFARLLPHEERLRVRSSQNEVTGLNRLGPRSGVIVPNHFCRSSEFRQV